MGWSKLPAVLYLEILDTVYAIYRYISIFRTTGLLLFMWVNTDKVKACVMVMTWTRVQYFMHSYMCIYTVHICIRDAWGGQYVNMYMLGNVLYLHVL